MGLNKPADNEGNIETYFAEEITVGGSAHDLWSKIQPFYHQVWGANIEVVEECFDVNGLPMDNCDAVDVTDTVEDCLDDQGVSYFPNCEDPMVTNTVTTTTETPLIDSKIYTITVLKSIPAASLESYYIIGTTANIQVVLPSVDAGTTSSKPL